LKTFTIQRLLKKGLLPEQATDGGYHIREGRVSLDIAWPLADANRMMPGVLAKDQADLTEQAQQTRGRQRPVGGVEVLIAMRTLEISNKDPANRYYADARFVPQTCAADPSHASIGASTPLDRGSRQGPTGHNLLGRGGLAALQRGASVSLAPLGAGAYRRASP